MRWWQSTKPPDCQNCGKPMVRCPSIGLEADVSEDEMDDVMAAIREAADELQRPVRIFMRISVAGRR